MWDKWAINCKYRHLSTGLETVDVLFWQFQVTATKSTLPLVSLAPHYPSPWSRNCSFCHSCSVPGRPMSAILFAFCSGSLQFHPFPVSAKSSSTQEWNFRLHSQTPLKRVHRSRPPTSRPEDWMPYASSANLCSFHLSQRKLRSVGLPSTNLPPVQSPY